MRASLPRIIILLAIGAAGCLVSVFVSTKVAPHRRENPRQITVLAATIGKPSAPPSAFSDPKTVRLRPVVANGVPHDNGTARAPATAMGARIPPTIVTVAGILKQDMYTNLSSTNTRSSHTTTRSDASPRRSGYNATGSSPSTDPARGHLNTVIIGSLANATAAVHRARFGEDGIDFRGTPPCGANTCFYKAKLPRNATREELGFGFLVTQQHSMEHMRRKWEASTYLATRYGRRHFLIGAPARHNISKHLETRLNQRIPRKKRYTHRVLVVVQKVRTAPRSLLIGCLGKKRTATLEGPGRFMEHYVKDREVFVSNLQRELKSTLWLMQQEPWYARDWQALVHPNGTLFEIDVAPVKLKAVAKDDILNCHEVLQTFFEKAEAVLYGAGATTNGQAR